MPGNSIFTTAQETPATANLGALLKSLLGAQPAPRQAPQIDPEKARQAVLRFLTILTADDERGQRSRAALRKMGEGALELLRELNG